MSMPASGLGCGCGGGALYGASCGCESGPGFMDRIKARFHKSSDCGCDTGCSAPVAVRHHKSDCGCAAPASCGCESGPSFFERLKGRFHKSSDCGCDSGCGAVAAASCSSCGGTSASGIMPVPATTDAPPAIVPAPGTPKVEPIPGPKISDPSKKLPDGKQVRATPFNNVPTLDVAPVRGESPF